MRWRVWLGQQVRKGRLWRYLLPVACLSAQPRTPTLTKGAWWIAPLGRRLRHHTLISESPLPCPPIHHNSSPARCSWREGPAYWGYASKYNVWLFEALASVFGSSLGLTDIPGVAGAARFPLYSTGAGALAGTALMYNWADAATAQEWSPFAQWWGGAPFADAAAGYWSRLGSLNLGPGAIQSSAWGGFVESLAFFNASGSVSDILALPTSKLYDEINVGMFRSAWDAPPAAQHFLSFKGGDSSYNHNHLDLGSFVFDYSGARFAEDLGSDNYEVCGTV